MPNVNDAQKALERIIRIARVHFYKPIQIAEILYRHRLEKGWDLNDLESYRNISKKWRDEISLYLVGRRSTSSQKYQDNLFEDNAMPPKYLSILGEVNKRGKGFVEAYIYKCLQARLSSVHAVWKYIKESTPNTFSLRQLVDLFQKVPGLKRSIDKMYEIAGYALFATLVRELKAQVTLEIKNEDKEILKDFEKFIKTVLGIDANNTKLVLPAALYRVGVANAADRGLDMWGNFGIAVQVKHLTLTPALLEDIAEDIMAERIVVVCLDAERQPIETLLKQIGWGERIQGIITLSDLDDWYQLCLGPKYKGKLGIKLLRDLQREFESEFPSSDNIIPFIQKRGYEKISSPKGWEAR